MRTPSRGFRRVVFLALLVAAALASWLWLAERDAQRSKSRRSDPPADATPEAPSIRVFGTITANGEPVPATITATSRGGAGRDQGEADAQGAYELALPEPGLYSFTIQLGEEHGDEVTLEMLSQIAGPAEQRVDIEIPVGSVEGHVHGADGPARDVAVVLLADGDLAHATSITGARTTTDEGGAYVIERLPAGSWTAMAGLRGAADPISLFTASAFRKVTVARGERRSGVDFEVDTGGVVRVRLLAASGEPAEDAELKLVRSSGGFSEWTGLCDSEGRFEIGGIEPGSYRLYAFHGVRESAELLFDAEAGRELELELRTAPATLVRAVFDADFDYADLDCRRSDGVSWRWFNHEADTADDEEVFGPLPPGTYTITHAPEGLPPSSRTVTLEGEREVRIEL